MHPSTEASIIMLFTLNNCKLLRYKMKYRISIMTFLLVFLVSCSSIKTSPPIKVSATELISEYERDSVAADKKYTGQTLIITGRVSNFVQLQDTLGIYLKSDVSESKWEIICFIDNVSNSDPFSQIRSGNGIITIIGKSRRKSDNTFIDIPDCKIQ